MSREATKQPEALRLADALDDEFTQGRISNHSGREAAAELRRLYERCEQWRDIHDAVVADSDKVYALLRQALEALESDPISHAGLVSRKQAITALRQALDTDLARVGEVGVWGECEPQEEVEDGWCNWVCPKPRSYLMQCCDCELIHEVDFRVARYESEDSEVYAVVDDPNLQAQMRLRRRDDLSPKREWVGLTLNEAEDLYEKYTDRAELINAVDKFLEEKNT
jgi:hypothetical protein